MLLEAKCGDHHQHVSNVMHYARRPANRQADEGLSKSLTAQRSQIWLLLAEGHLTRTVRGAILRWLAALSVLAGDLAARCCKSVRPKDGVEPVSEKFGWLWVHPRTGGLGRRCRGTRRGKLGRGTSDGGYPRTKTWL